MIGKLKGIVDSTGEDVVILDVGGVGYVVHCSARTLGQLPAIGEAASLSIETHVREDMIRLYGFRSDSEREWFRLLQGVQGVGAKVALAILSVLDPGALAVAVAGGDKAAIARAPGVGPKLAARIAAEMKDKARAGLVADPFEERLVGGGPDPTVPPATADAVSALVNLGWGELQARAAVASVVARAGEGTETRDLIKSALREIGR